MGFVRLVPSLSTRIVDGVSSLDTAQTVLVEMPRAECLELLARSHFGRVGISRGDDAPINRPVLFERNLEEISGGRHLILRTDRASADMAGDVLALLDLRLRRSA